LAVLAVAVLAVAVLAVAVLAVLAVLRAVAVVLVAANHPTLRLVA
jgi:hypothetical protein